MKQESANNTPAKVQFFRTLVLGGVLGRSPSSNLGVGLLEGFSGLEYAFIDPKLFDAG